MDVQQLAFIAGIILGCIAVLSACYVWLRHRAFGAGGGSLSFVGLALVGMSIWSTVSITVSEAGLEAKFEALEERVTAVAEASATVTQEVQKVVRSAEANRAQFLALTENLVASDAVDRQAAAAFRREVAEVPPADVSELNNALERLRDVQMPVTRQRDP